MEKLELKLKVSILWMANTVLDLVQIALSFFDPGFIENPVKGQVFPAMIGNGHIAAFTFSLVAPVAMAFLVFVIRNPRVNKWANVILGLVIALMSWGDFLAKVSGMTPVFVASAFATNVAPTVLVFYAWRLDSLES